MTDLGAVSIILVGLAGLALLFRSADLRHPRAPFLRIEEVPRALEQTCRRMQDGELVSTGTAEELRSAMSALGLALAEVPRPAHATERRVQPDRRGRLRVERPV